MEALPALDGFVLAADWAPQAQCWMAWPSRVERWGADYDHACLALAGLARAVSEILPVTMLAPARFAATAMLQLRRSAEIEPHELQDGLPGAFGPLFLRDDDGGHAALACRFNGWGNRVHDYDGDAGFATWLGRRLDLPLYECPLTLEAGALATDGAGTLLASRDVLLDPHRNPTVGERQAEDLLALHCGIRRVIWLEGRPGDGALAGMARFVRPGTVLCAAPGDGPAGAIAARNRAVLEGAEDARGRPLELIELPAGYADLRILNGAVLAPAFDVPADAKAHAVLAEAYSGRGVLPVPMARLAAGGAGLGDLLLPQPLAPR